MYISLGNRENCNKCISAFVYTFLSKELHNPLSVFFLLHWHGENVGTRLACFQLQVNVNIWKLATGTWDIEENCVKCACKWADRCHSSTNPDQEKHLTTTRLSRKLHFSTLTSPELIRAAWITLNGWSVPHAHSWGISSIGTFQSFLNLQQFCDILPGINIYPIKTTKGVIM